MGGNGREELSQHGAGSITIEVQEIDDSEVASRTNIDDGYSHELVPNGRRALLRTLNAKVVLFLGCATQVRRIRSRQDATPRNPECVSLLPC